MWANKHLFTPPRCPAVTLTQRGRWERWDWHRTGCKKSTGTQSLFARALKDRTHEMMSLKQSQPYVRKMVNLRSDNQQFQLLVEERSRKHSINATANYHYVQCQRTHSNDQRQLYICYYTYPSGNHSSNPQKVEFWQVSPEEVVY